MKRPSVGDAIKEAQAALQQGEPQRALALLAAPLDAEPDHIDGLYCRAVAYRLVKNMPAAQQTLDRLIALQPDFGRAHQERGHLYRGIGEAGAARAAYERAVQLNPALVASWRYLATLLAAAGLSRQAKTAHATAAHWQTQPPTVAAAAIHLHEGRLLKAEKLLRAFLQKQPQQCEAMRLLAELADRFGALEEAVFVLDSAVAFHPDQAAARFDYIQILKKCQRYEQAAEQLAILRSQHPDTLEYHNQQAILDLQRGRFDQAIAGFDRVLRQRPDDPGVLTSKGHALKTHGHRQEAIAAYRAACQARPAHGDAWYGLANLKTYRFQPAEIDRMKQILAPGVPGHTDAIPLHFSLAKALEDEGCYQQAMDHLRQGNQLKRQLGRYDADRMDEELSAQKNLCSAALFERHKGHGCPAPDPIFIVGLPRAGSTLIEQILASHSLVDGTLELPTIISLSHTLRGRKRVSEETRYPAILHDLPGERLAALGQRYIDDTRIHRQTAPFFTDKMPNNFRHIGLIALILPKAKIIDARRSALDCCFSGFRQLFAQGQEFSYSLADIGRYYRGYVALMAHWDRVLPGRIHRVHHEALIDDPEGEIRQLLGFLDLPFEESCLAFHNTERAIRTASSEQVRRAVNREGQGRWKPFEPWLGDLFDALGPLAYGSQTPT